MPKQQIIASIPETMAFDELPEPVQELFGHIGWEAPDGYTMPGTRAYNGRRLIHFQTEATAPTVDWLAQILDQVEGFGWQIEAAQAFEVVGSEDVYRPVPASLIDYVPDIVEYDDEGNEISRSRPTAPVELHRYAGSDPWVWAS